MNRNILGILPARGGSKGIPRKNLIPFCGKPLIAWTIAHALGSSSIRDLYVSTEDDEIAAVSRAHGAKVIKRPAELAGDAATSESALLHALNLIESEISPVDLVVFYQATSPLRQPQDTDNAVALLLSEEADSLFSATKLDDSTIWTQDGAGYRSVTYDYKNRARRQDRQPSFLENGSIYIFTPQVLKTDQNRIGGKLAIYLMPLWQSFEIDAPDEIELVEYYMKRFLLSPAQS